LTHLHLNLPDWAQKIRNHSNLKFNIVTKNFTKKKTFLTAWQSKNFITSPKKQPPSSNTPKKVKNETRAKQKAIWRQLKAIALMTPFLLTSRRSLTHTCIHTIDMFLSWRHLLNIIFFSPFVLLFIPTLATTYLDRLSEAMKMKFFYYLHFTHFVLRNPLAEKWKTELYGIKIELKKKIKLNLDRVFFYQGKSDERNCIVCLAKEEKFLCRKEIKWEKISKWKFGTSCLWWFVFLELYSEFFNLKYCLTLDNSNMCHRWIRLWIEPWGSNQQDNTRALDWVLKYTIKESCCQGPAFSDISNKTLWGKFLL